MQRTTDTSANLTNQAIRGRSVCQRWLLAAGRKRSLPEHRERRSNAAAVARTEADLRDAVERSACPTEAAKGVALDRTNRTYATHKSYVSYWSHCMAIAPASNVRSKPPASRLHRPPAQNVSPSARRSDSPPARMKFTSVSPKLARLTRSSPYSHVQWPPQSKSPWPVFDAPASAAGAGMRTCGKCSGA